MIKQPVVEAPQRRRVPAELARDAPELLPESPYKGLSYYDQPDAPFFFGREQETQVVAANLRASRLTVLYGESGVGKSSLLRAGAARHLMEIARENVDRRGTPRLVVAIFPNDDGAARTTWRDDPLPAILGAVQRAVASLGLDIPCPPPERDLCAQLAAWTELLGSDLLIILDQFEEYLLYHEGEDGPGTLAAELPRAVLQTNLRANFLISIREDMLAGLDSFKRRIPAIFDNCVRVKHLDRESARAAIEKPIGRYNDVRGAGDRMKIEPRLVDTLLRELEAGRVVVGLAGAGTSDEGLRAHPQAIETPYLQLVMTRLWKEEMRTGSRVLRLATLERLGHSDCIVKTHLDGTMRTLPRYARYVAARAFHHLVTPSGSKIAHSPGDLAAYAGLDERDIEPVLERLTEPEYRILRRVALATAEDAPARYEIFHDVLGTPILDWRSRYLRTREVAEVVRSGITALLLVVFGFASILILIALAFTSLESWTNTVWVAWAAIAVMIWVSTTVVLVKRWQRREAWAVPLVGIVAAAIAPVTALAFAANAAVRLPSLVRRRLGHVARSERASDDRSASGVRRLAGFAAIVGAGMLVLTCFLPACEFTTYNAEGFQELSSSSETLIESSGRRWFALLPLTAAAFAALAGVLALGRPRPRRFLLGLVSGLAVGALAYFFSLLWWGDALTPYATDLSRDADSFTYNETQPGLLLGVGGAGVLLLLATAPLVTIEIFASIIGAGRRVQGKAREVLRMDLDRARSSMQIPLSVLGAVGAATAITSTVVESAGWGRTGAGSLFDISFWAALPVAVLGAVAATAAAVIVFGDRVGERAAGFLAGCGVALLALFLGVFGSLDWQPPLGAYVGAGAGTLLAVAGGLGLAAQPTRASATRSPGR